MRNTEQQYVYNERCIGYLTILIKSGMAVKHQTPAQAERVWRWRRARRALQNDQVRLRQQLPPDNQLDLETWGQDARDAQAWFHRQLLSYLTERTKNLCFEGVEQEPTPGTEGL